LSQSGAPPFGSHDMGPFVCTQCFMTLEKMWDIVCCA
jgi:hypothetical protein